MPYQMNGIPPSRKSVYCKPHPCIENSFQVPIGGQMIDLASISSKMVYKEFRSLKEILPTAQAKFKDKYPELSIDWKKIYPLAFSVTLDTNLRVFQYKLLNRIVWSEFFSEH